FLIHIPPFLEVGDTLAYFAGLVELALIEPLVELDAKGFESLILGGHHTLQGRRAEKSGAFGFRRKLIAVPGLCDDSPGDVFDILAAIAVGRKMEQHFRRVGLRNAWLDDVLFALIRGGHLNRMAQMLKIAERDACREKFQLQRVESIV